MNNIGKFIRKLSTDTENENNASSLNNKSSLISGTSKLFDSVNSKTTNLVSGLSNTFEQIKRRASIETLSFTDKESLKEENEDNVKEESIISGYVEHNTPSLIEQESSQIVKPVDEHLTRKLPPPKPPPPLTKQKSTPHDNSVPQRDHFNRSQTLAQKNKSDEIYNNDYLNKQGGKLATEVIEDAQNQIEKMTQIECQKIVSEMDNLMKDPSGGFNDTSSNQLTVEREENSSPSEYGDRGDNPVYDDGNFSNNPDNTRRISDASMESDLEEMTEEHKAFLDSFVNILFNNVKTGPADLQIPRFKKISQIRSARGWFTKLVQQNQYVNSKQVSEFVFYRLVHVFTVILLECYENEDFLPARDLLLLAFGCFTSMKAGPQQSAHNLYLSSFICCHPIWKSIQFWSFCFFNAVQEVRSKKATVRRNSANTTDADGVAFHQLQVHLNYMRSLGLPINLCSEFVRKQVNIVNLTDDEMGRLKEVMDSWKD